MAKRNYEKMANLILELVGGKENIANFAHCVTRLRFNVKDKSLVDVEKLGKIEGSLGTQWSGEQLQVIIGQDVEKLYRKICEISGIEVKEAIDEKLDKINPGGRFSLKRVGQAILSYVFPTVIGVLPLMVAASMCKTFGVVFGPNVLNVISDTSDLYIMFDFLYDAFFYFLPIYLGYQAAKTLKMNPLLGMYIGAVIMVPDFLAMVGVRESFHVFGIGVPVSDYSSTFLPVMIGVWIMSYIYKFFKKIIPEVVSMLFVPTLTLLVMTAVMFLVCAPIGAYLGTLIGNLLIAMSNANIIIRLIAYIALAVLFPYIIMGGMHLVLINFAIVSWLSVGYELFVLPVSFAYSFAIYGLSLGAAIKIKDKDEKVLVTGYTVTGLLAGVSEPILYGIVLKYKNAIKALVLACAVGGIFCGIFLPKMYVAGSLCNVFSAVSVYAGGGMTNIVIGLLSELIPFVAGVLAAVFMINFESSNAE